MKDERAVDQLLKGLSYEMREKICTQSHPNRSALLSTLQGRKNGTIVAQWCCEEVFGNL
jgi:hypothetical protein